MSFLINPYRFGRLWTPADITTALWLDAADASTITTVSGAVSQWNDKSGNGRNVSQSTAANRPALTSAGLNSLDVVTFDGSNDVLSVALSTGLSSSFSISAVVVPLSTNAIEGYINAEVSSFSNYWATLGLGGDFEGSKIGTAMFDGTNNPLAYGTTPTISQAYIINSLRDVTSVTLQYWQNGTQTNSTTDTTTTTPSYGTLTIGGQINQPTRYANVRIGEVVILSSSPSTTDRQRIEGYLAHKWGLAGSLPAGHPFKSAPPTV